MKNKLFESLILAGALVTPAFFTTANASSEGVSLRIQLSASVATECQLRTAGAFQQLGANVFRIGSVDRFCNTAHQMILSHNARTNGGMVSFDGQNIPLQDTQLVLVENGAPVANRSDIIISGIDAITAQDIARSLQLQIVPRNL